MPPRPLVSRGSSFYVKLTNSDVSLAPPEVEIRLLAGVYNCVIKVDSLYL